MMATTLRLAYSPDADDAFMFRAAIQGLIDTEGLSFQPATADTQRLNELADSGHIDVCAISVAAYPFIAERFALLDHGGSVGRNYGPVIVAKENFPAENLSQKSVATPGLRTTAHFVAGMIAPGARFSVVPVTPYQAVFQAIESGAVDAGIIIHEGRLTYPAHGMVEIVDLGRWWWQHTGLPLPLGANVIRRALGADLVARASRVLQRSIRWALDNREQMIDFLISHIHRPDEVAQPALLDKYLAMYANEETHQYSPESHAAVQRIFDIGFQRGLYAQRVVAEFV